MFRTLLAAALIAGFGLASSIEAVDAAQSTSAKSKRAASHSSTRRVAVAASSDRSRSTSTSALPLRDRSTINLANGRLNGREFFDRLNEQSSGAGD